MRVVDNVIEGGALQRWIFCETWKIFKGEGVVKKEEVFLPGKGCHYHRRVKKFVGKYFGHVLVCQKSSPRESVSREWEVSTHTPERGGCTHSIARGGEKTRGVRSQN